VLDGSVDCTSASGEVVKATAGRRLLLPDSGAIQWAAARGTEGLWTRGQMALNDEPLRELVDAMQHYRRGVIQIDESAARLRVSGLFSLDDTDATLRALVQTQPVRVREITRYWVQISAA
jgi:transmembrane sensor